jgi:hypothetical protein
MLENMMDIMGWAGAAFLLIPYWMISNGKMNGHSKSYQYLNIAGGLLLIVNSYYYGALPSVFVNVIWIFIGLTASYNLTKKNRTKKGILKNAQKKVLKNDGI